MEREKSGIIVILLRGEIKINREKGGFFMILGEWKTAIMEREKIVII